MKFGIDRLLAEPAAAQRAARQATRAARASRVGHRGPHAFARRARATRRSDAERRVRSAAWPARRQAGQHGRVADVQRSGARHSGLQPLRRSAPPDRGDDGHVRRAARRSAGRRLPHLHLHHHAALRARRGCRARQERVDSRSAESSRAADRRPAIARGLGKLRRRRAAADASRPDAGRARALVRAHAALVGRLQGDRDARLAAVCCAGFRLAARRAHVDQSEPERRRICGWRAPTPAR